jgi:hypothetical protein
MPKNAMKQGLRQLVTGDPNVRIRDKLFSSSDLGVSPGSHETARSPSTVTPRSCAADRGKYLIREVGHQPQFSADAGERQGAAYLKQQFQQSTGFRDGRLKWWAHRLKQPAGFDGIDPVRNKKLMN